MFTKVFGDSTDQEIIFNDSFAPSISDLLEKGMGGLLFSYGITGSGKTYTIMGTDSDTGILPRTVGTLVEINRKI